jgi:hypothetical protein
MTRRLTAALMTSLVVCAAVCLAADETLSGYDAWRFGMTTGEVAQVKELGPYSPVPATGGLETKNGKFLGEKTNISFIFGPHGLRRIQICRTALPVLPGLPWRLFGSESPPRTPTSLTS